VEFFIKWIPRIISGVMSLMDAANLRNRVHSMQDEHEIMWTALDDIARMYKDHPSGEHAKKTLNHVAGKYGR
jgi:hypothetical protein